MTDMADATRLSQPLLEKIGREVRARRKALPLTVQQLADAAGLSRRIVTKIELGQANASLTTIDRLAAALAVDFSTLIQGRLPQPSVQVTSKMTNEDEWVSESGGRLVFHAATSVRPAAELWEGTLAVDARLQAPADPPGSEVLVFVISGVLTLCVGTEPIVEASSGESARLRTDQPHEYANRGSVPVHFLRVFQIGPAES
ncbi:Cro/Cl family transcriptional regulator [Arthrobacter sp. MYb23]|uniref:helix-turn-helix domain-containing protein n=1 Tax=unclassified Arthrobacter TaxID=235627 RepID=UPI000CFCE48E|nr:MULTISPECIES: helix-turn-helix domain-containing protein [unclassified Arthrobacter]PRB43067.1 Cro/Cl family transcriptional regulator [Arthrobacter sp. MYb51]PRB98019.1 Cro/Cl family transcriptional regulator [Arthrobacter sp. MYb23]